ncbi:hypothetical protein E1B28_003553 [Marasmius oreades]|uniref:Uncharacterized protein n=1 Tax=Marasmius oreades TaxID=181124 RepID=A0A9P7RMF7_9AGAR|nr:uncharacterized protein E1B28_003553 [Marasmius oreades]KAG7086032.1 hypothetical protein E1B28_003553 [Marasmius oreades]
MNTSAIASTSTALSPSRSHYQPTTSSGYFGAGRCESSSTASFIANITPSVDDGYFAFAKIGDEICVVQVSSLTPLTALSTIDIKVFRHEFVAIFRLDGTRTMHPDDVCVIETIDDRLKCYEEEKEIVFLAKEVIERMRQLSPPHRVQYRPRTKIPRMLSGYTVR